MIRALVTAGPTREYIDSVRYLSNGSSGKTGLAIANEFRRNGFKVHLIIGPGINAPSSMSATRVVSAVQMFKEVKRRFSSCDVFVSCAAVADYRPQTGSRKKIKKTAGAMTLKLVPNPDILLEMGRIKGGRFLAGFALEDSGGLKEARRKLERKNCDLMVLNGPAAVEADTLSATLLFPDRRPLKLGKISKETFAQKLCQEILKSHSLSKNM